MNLAESLRALVALDRVIETLPDNPAALRLVLDQAATLTKAEAGVVVWADGPQPARVAHARGLDLERVRTFSAPSDDHLGAAVQAHFFVDPPAGFLAVPVVVDGRRRGLLALSYPQPQPAGGAETLLVAALADRAALHLAQGLTRKLADRLRLLDAVSVALLNAADVPTVCEALARLLLPRHGDWGLVELFGGVSAQALFQRPGFDR